MSFLSCPTWCDGVPVRRVSSCVLGLSSAPNMHFLEMQPRKSRPRREDARCVCSWQQRNGATPEARPSVHFTFVGVPVRTRVSVSGLPYQVTTDWWQPPPAGKAEPPSIPLPLSPSPAHGTV